MGIYTIGHEGDYDDALARFHAGESTSPVAKLGPHTQPDGSPYFGGYAFETVADALAHIDRIGKRGEYAVYEMDAVWPDDVWHGHPQDEHMLLRRDAVLIRKIGPHAKVDPADQDAFADK